MYRTPSFRAIKLPTRRTTPAASAPVGRNSMSRRRRVNRLAPPRRAHRERWPLWTCAECTVPRCPRMSGEKRSTDGHRIGWSAGRVGRITNHSSVRPGWLAKRMTGPRLRVLSWAGERETSDGLTPFLPRANGGLQLMCRQVRAEHEVMDSCLFIFPLMRKSLFPGLLGSKNSLVSGGRAVGRRLRLRCAKTK